MTVQFNSQVFDEFLQNEGFILHEEPDMDYLRNLVNDKNVSKSDKGLIKAYIKDGVTPVPVTYSKKETSGAYCPDKTFQAFSKEINWELNRRAENMCIDIVNSSYTIIYEIARLNNVDFPAIHEYIEDQEGVIRKCLRTGYNFNEGKTYFFNLLYHPEREFLPRIVAELQQAHTLFRHPSHPEFSLTKIVDIYSSFIMQRVYEYLVKNGFMRESYCSLKRGAIYFKPLKPVTSEVMENIEEYVKETTQLNIKFH
jgi:hypothetical protein